MTADPKTDMLSAQTEAKMVLGQVVNDVLNKTGEKRVWNSCTIPVQQVQMVLSWARSVGPQQICF
jgi:hypothetical protein